MQPSPPVAVVGMSSIFAGSHDVLGFWRDIVSATDRLTDVPPEHWLIQDYYDPDPTAPDMTYAKRGGYLDPLSFNPMEFGLPPNSIPATDTAQLLALIAAKRVLEDAGRFRDGEMDQTRTSVILGVASATELVVQMGARLQHPIWKKALRDAGLPESRVQEIVQRIKDHYQPWQESTFPGLLGNVVAGRIANRLNLGGSNYVTDAACASSLSAVKAGLAELYLGDSDTVIAGGVDALNDILMYMCFSKTPAFSPTGDCRPFSEDADGTLIGEGVGMVVLRRLEDAEADGDPIYAVIRGLGSSSDGKGSSVYAPRPEGQAYALRRAYERADYSPATVELVEGHGTATKAGDVAEARGLASVFATSEIDEEQWCALGSVKSQIGHTKAAAGSAGMIKVALALHHKILPPTLKVSKPNGKLALADSPIYINTEARPWIRGSEHPRRGSVSSFGFGGSNFHVALEEYVGPGRRPLKLRFWEDELFLASADDAAGLENELGRLANKVEGGYPLARLAHETAAAFDSKAGARVAIVAAGAEDFSARVHKARKALKDGQARALPDPDISFGFGAPTEGKVAFVFPGQGSQYVGMGSAAAMAFDRVREVWDRVADMDVFAGDRLDRAVFPRPAFTAEERSAQAEQVTKMTTAQPAIAAVSLGYLRLLRLAGVEAQAVAGHSFGELTALAAAGRIDEAELLATARKRGELMAEAADSRAGAMIAVASDAETVAAHLDRSGVVIANDNAPNEVVLAGSVDAIDAMSRKLSEAGLRSVRLPVASAFHSEIVADSCEPFHDHLQGVDFHDTSVAVFANKTAGVYPTEADRARRILADQLASPVRFREMVEAMYESGVTHFVEVGPGRVLTKLVGRILGDRPHLAAALDDKKGSGLRALWRGLGQLATAGVSVDVNALTEGYRVPDAPSEAMPFEVMISGTNSEKPYPPANGAAGLPAPNPEVPESSPTALNTPTSSASTARMAAAPDSNGSAPASVPSAPSGAPASVSPAPAPVPVMADRPSSAPSPHVQTAAIAAHQRYMELMAESHRSFLQMAAGAMGAGASVPTPTTTTPTTTAPVSVAAMAVAPSVSEPAAVAEPKPERVPQPAAVSPPAPSWAAEPETSSTAASPAPTIPVEAVAPAPAVDVTAVALEVVSEKTGYPVEMLDLDMEMEAGLGIDSIKQVEILSELQARIPGVPEIEPSELATLRTLRDVADKLSTGMGAAAAGAGVAVVGAAAGSVSVPAAAATVAGEGTALAAVDVTAIALEVVSEKTGYPIEMLDLDMEMEAGLGIDSIKQVEILSELQERIPGVPEIEPSELATLRTLRDVADKLSAGMGSVAVAATGAADAVASSAAPAEAPSPLPSEAPSGTGGAEAAVDVTAIALQVVAEKTGYPVEMLDLDMEMEAGLGIDSIKQVEILSELQERIPGVPEIQPAELAQLRTLRDVADKLAMGGAPTTAGEAASGEAPSRKVASPSAASRKVVASGSPSAEPDAPEGEPARPGAVAPATPHPAAGASRRGPPAVEQTTVPSVSVFVPHMVTEERPGFGMLGLTPGMRVEVTDEAPELAAAIVEGLEAGGASARMVATPSHAASAVVSLAALAADPGSTSSLSVHTRIIEAARAVSALQEVEERLFVTVQSTGGDFGLDSDPGASSWTGGAAGVVKTAAREWPGAAVKAIDVANVSGAAAYIVEELFAGGPALEVGYAADGTRAVVHIEPLTLSSPDGPALEPGDVVVVSGGARGVTATSVSRLAERWGVRLVLLGRSSLGEWPREMPLSTDVVELTAALAAGARSRGETIDLPSLQKEARSLAAAAEVRLTLAGMEERGVQAKYVSADVSDAGQVAAALASVRETWGPIRGIVHGAGVLRDKALAGMTPDRVAEVFGPKVEGLSVLLEETRDDPLGMIALFSSVAARAGNSGQSAYAAANEVLNKVGAAEAHRRGDSCTVRSYNWGPWDGGMVDAGLAAHFAKQGVALLNVDDGADYFVEDLGRKGGSVERVVLASPSFATRSQRLCADTQRGGMKTDDSGAGRDYGDSAVVADTALRLGESLKPVGTMSVTLEDFVITRPGWGAVGEPSRPHTVDIIPLEDNGAGHRLVFSGPDGQPHHEAVLRYSDAGTMPPPEVPSGGLEPWPFDVGAALESLLDSIGEARSILHLEGVSAEGGMALLRSVAPSWPVSKGRPAGFNPALFAGLLQLGTLWTHQRSGAAQSLARMGTMVVHRLEAIPERVRSAFRARQTERGTLFDFVLATEDGRLLAQLHEVQFEAPGV